MAKKKKTTRKTSTRARRRGPVSEKRDLETIASIEKLADGITKDGLKGRDPSVDIPLRTGTNMN